jgi:hypothetical protein
MGMKLTAMTAASTPNGPEVMIVFNLDQISHFLPNGNNNCSVLMSDGKQYYFGFGISKVLERFNRMYESS